MLQNSIDQVKPANSLFLNTMAYKFFHSETYVDILHFAYLICKIKQSFFSKPTKQKELINQNIETSISLFQLGIKFYLKIQSSFFVLLNSIRVYEMSFIKTKHYAAFYSDLFDFLVKAINDETFDPELDDEPASEAEEENKHVARQKFVFKFLLALFLQHRTVICASAEMFEAESASMVSSRFTRIKQALVTKLKPLSNGKYEICIYSLLVDTYELILSYTAQFHKKPSDGTNKENAAYEKKLTQKLLQLSKAVDKEKNVFFFWILNTLIELFFSIMNIVYINKPNLHATFLSESLIECLHNFGCVCSHNLNSLHVKSSKASNQAVPASPSASPAVGSASSTSASTSSVVSAMPSQPKNALFKPLIYFISIAKQAELMLKKSNLTSDPL
jgi:hypothetical protein